MSPQRTKPWIVAVFVAVALVAGGCGSGEATPSSGAPPTGSPSSPTPATTPPSTTDALPSSGAPPTDVPASPDAQPSASPGDPPAVTALSLEPFAEGLASPTFVTHAGDGSGLLYVVEQEGRIRTVNQDGTVGETPFLDIAERVVSGGEQGLLGLAFHPDYPDDTRFYVMYTAAADGANTVSEFRVADGTADPASERILLAIPDFAVNHNGGMVAFGPDGYLYAGTGDGGGGGDPQDNGQDPFALLGKILRIDVDGEAAGGTPYAIPADNPFADGALAAPDVWAIGMRNPWRFTFDRETGDLWIADVGQGQWEEVNAEPTGSGGRNYGWSIMEGPDCFEADSCDQAALTLPVTAYEHGQGDCTVVGGYVYRGETYPEMQGTYVYGDFCSGRIWGLDAAAAISEGAAEPVDLLQAGISLSSFGEDEAGELYAVDLAGSIHRLVPDGAATALTGEEEMTERLARRVSGGGTCGEHGTLTIARSSPEFLDEVDAEFVANGAGRPVPGFPLFWMGSLETLVAQDHVVSHFEEGPSKQVGSSVWIEQSWKAHGTP